VNNFARLLAAAAMLLSTPVLAAQQLIETPYPEQLSPNAEDVPAPLPSYHQHLIAQPSPWAYGPDALGDPKPVRRHRHQHLVEEPYPWLSW
jgi:hypothetical protein